MALNLGDIRFGLGPDVTALRSAMRDVYRFGDALDHVAQQQGAAARQVEAAMRRQEAAVARSLERMRNLTDRARLGGLGNSPQIQELQRTFRELTQDMASGVRSPLEFQRAMMSFNAATTQATRALREQENQLRLHTTAQRVAKREMLAMAALEEGIARVADRNIRTRRNREEFNAFTESMRKLGQVSVLINGPLGGVAARLSTLSVLAKESTATFAVLVAGIAGGAWAFVQVGKHIIQTEKTFQAFERRFEGLTGAAALAQVEMEYMSRTADRLGMNLRDATDQYASMMAAAKGTKLEGEGIRDVFENVAAVGSKMQLGPERMQGVMRALEQMISKGNVQMEELRGQLADRIPGAVQVAASALGVTTAELNRMVAAGEVAATDFLPKFAQKLADLYGVNADERINNITASEQRFSNALAEASREIDKQLKYSAGYQRALDSLATVIKTVANNVDTIVAAMGGVAGAFAALALPTLITGFGSLAIAIRGAAASLLFLNNTAARTPLGKIGMMLAQIAIGTTGAYLGYEAMSAAMEDSSDATKDGAESLRAYIAANKELNYAGSKTTAGFLTKSKQEIIALGYELDKARKRYDALTQAALNQPGVDPVNDPHAGQTPETEAEFKRIQMLEAALAKRQELHGELMDVQKKQLAYEAEVAKRGGDEAKAMTNRQIMALEEAREAIRNAKGEYEAFLQGDEAVRKFKEELEITSAVDRFSDNLRRAKIPLGEVTALTKEFETNLRLLKEQQLFDERTISSVELLNEAFDQGLNNSVDTFVDGIREGELSAQMFKDVWLDVLAEIAKQMLKLAVINPLLNAFFPGQTPLPTFSFSGVKASAKGNVFGRGLSQGASIWNTPRGLHSMNESGPEAVMPLVRDSGGRLGVQATGGAGQVTNEIHVHTPPGSTVKRRETRTDQGMRTDLFVDLLLTDIEEEGPLSRKLQTQYGLNRARGIQQ
jgi:tape measure domain-containing protein